MRELREDQGGFCRLWPGFSVESSVELFRAFLQVNQLSSVFTDEPAPSKADSSSTPSTFIELIKAISEQMKISSRGALK